MTTQNSDTQNTVNEAPVKGVGTGELVRLGRNFTQINVTPEKRKAAILAAYWITCSPCEWEWTEEQQADMARYVLWASQRIEAMQHVANGLPLLHEPNIADHAQPGGSA